jgi:hypothetical protein
MPHKPENAADFFAERFKDCDASKGDVQQALIDLVRSDTPLSAVWRETIAQQLEDYYFPSLHRRRRRAQAVQGRQYFADAYREMIGRIAQAEGITKAKATEKVAAKRSMSVEALAQSLKPSRVRGDKNS